MLHGQAQHELVEGENYLKGEYVNGAVGGDEKDQESRGDSLFEYGVKRSGLRVDGLVIKLEDFKFSFRAHG
jgi:hypothetical protein